MDTGRGETWVTRITELREWEEEVTISTQDLAERRLLKGGRNVLLVFSET